MSKHAHKWIGLALFILALLAGTYAIVTRNNAAMNPSPEATPAGFVH
jgi:hypothetical protein